MKGQTDIDARSDIYGLGILLFQMLTGRVPYDADNTYEILRKQVDEALPTVLVTRPDLPPAIDGILQRACAKNREHRFADCAEMKRVLQDIPQTHAPLPAPIAGKPGKTVLEEPVIDQGNLGYQATGMMPGPPPGLSGAAPGGPRATPAGAQAVRPQAAATAPTKAATPAGAQAAPAGTVPRGPAPVGPAAAAAGAMLTARAAAQAGAQAAAGPGGRHTGPTPGAVSAGTAPPGTAPAAAPGTARLPATPTGVGPAAYGTPSATTGAAQPSYGPAATPAGTITGGTELSGGSPQGGRGGLIALVAAVAVAGVVTVLFVSGTIDISGETPGGPSTQTTTTAPPETTTTSEPDESPFSDVIGMWISPGGRELEAVVVGDTVELQVVDPAQFAEFGYRKGEARVILHPTEKKHRFLVEDRYRLKPPPGYTFASEDARATCQAIYKDAEGNPLRATLSKDRLDVDSAKIQTGPKNFQTTARKVRSCIGLDVIPRTRLPVILRRNN